jgi:hypothetical protein
LPGGDDSETINRFIAKYDLQVQPGTAAYTHLCTETKRAYRDYCAAVLDYDRSLDSYEFPSQPMAHPTIQSIAANVSQVSIRELSDLYTKDSNLGGQWVKKTGHEKADHISLLIEILGEHTDIAAISPSDAQRVKSILIRYPRNRRKNPTTRGLALVDALDCAGVQTINVQTINKYLQTYGTMFTWAERNAYVSKNVFEGLAVRLGKKQQSKTARTAFSQNQVQIIMQELLHNSRGIVLKPYQKWGPLIALYSGARLNEIAQIRQVESGDVDLRNAREFIEHRIPVLAQANRSGEIIWLLFLAIRLNISLSVACLNALFEIENSMIALLIAFANSRRLVQGAIDFRLWNRSLNSDGLKGPMWLYAYESVIKKINPLTNTAFIQQDAYFSLLYAKDVHFLAIDNGFSSISSTLRSLRGDNDRRRRMRDDFIDDFDLTLDEFDDEEDDQEDDTY